MSAIGQDAKGLAARCELLAQEMNDLHKNFALSRPFRERFDEMIAEISGIRVGLWALERHLNPKIEARTENQGQCRPDSPYAKAAKE